MSDSTRQSSSSILESAEPNRSRSVKKVLITGGSGLIGGHLTSRLIAKGYDVRHLGRRRRNSGEVETFVWDPVRNQMDKNALIGVDAIVHLAGSGVADKRWNDAVKKEIMSSRVDTTRLLREAIAQMPRHQVKVFVSSSGINYYGLNEQGGAGFVEEDRPGEDFMAQVCIAWEKEVKSVETLGIRCVMLRTGMVLTPNGGALEKLVTPVRFFAGTPLGSGRQSINWIHIDDLCDVYIKAIEDEAMRGAYNAVAPNPVTNAEFTREIARTLKRPIWLPPVPGFVVRLLVGGVADIVLNGGKVSSQKIKKAGFQFAFPTAQAALRDLLT